MRRSQIEIGPLLVEQRRIADQYRVAEKVVQDLHTLTLTEGAPVGNAGHYLVRRG